MAWFGFVRISFLGMSLEPVGKMQLQKAGIAIDANHANHACIDGLDYSDA